MMYSESRIFEGRGHNCVVSALFMVAASAILPCATKAGTYTWIGGNSGGTWDKTSLNWSDGTTSGVAWQDGNDAVFNNTAAMTITVSGAISAANVTGNSTGNITFKGSGTLTWTGWLTSQGHVYFSNPLVLADDGNGLHFNNGGHVFLNTAQSSYTGGTYFKNTNNNTVRAFSLNGGDLALGPIPATPQDNIFALGGTVALFVDSGISTTLHENRRILISDGKDMFVCPNGTLRIKGMIHGQNASSGYPTGTRIRVYRNNTWKGKTIFDQGSGVANHVGRLFVQANLEIASGITRLTTVNGGGSGDALPLYVQGDGTAYSDTWGHLLLTGGAVANYQGGRRFQTSAYGHIDAAGGTVSFEAGEYLSALDSPGKLTVRDGGNVIVHNFRVSQCQTGNGGETFLKAGGLLRVGTFTMYTGYTGAKGTIHFDGGTLQSKYGYDYIAESSAPEGYTPTNFIAEASHEKWSGITFSVEAGGAVFDTSNGKNLWWNKPLVSGVANGETDGGLTAKGGGAVVLFNATHSYNGPTRVETSGTRLQIRTANILPSGTTVQLAGGTSIGFNTWGNPRQDLAQTVSRAEGHGKIFNNSLFVVTDAIAPVFNGEYGTLTIEQACSLNCDFEIVGDANGCSCISLEKAGSGNYPKQDISGLTLNVANFAALDKDAPRDTYKILDAPYGYTGTFAKPAGWPEDWDVKYTATAAYLRYKRGMVISLK